jgi:hypothetical protein
VHFEIALCHARKLIPAMRPNVKEIFGVGHSTNQTF